MAEETPEPQGSDTVSKAAFDRVKHENEQLQQQMSQLNIQLEQSRKVNRVESLLRDKEIPKEEIPGRMELLAPHLADIPMDGLEAALADQKFAPLLTPPASTPPPPLDDGESPPQTPPGSVPANGGFGGQPNPGGNFEPVAQGVVGPGDAEYDTAYQAARTGDHSKMQALYDANRVKEPTRTW